ncbi:putative phosphate transporter [Dactylonectria macrodidyma]|uniref:Phosphate transporter n=1 Tax=Dactylonectria macrodidyma TaxID=307937 RepID=A0A9P9EA83_9HYPO|nr:putative phosphate transporter [Dactylonectria macrodidyma]
MALSSYITNIIIIFGIMQITRSISFDDPTVLNTVRGAFLVSNALIALLYGYIYILIRKQKDLNTLKSVNSTLKKPPTIYEYDQQQLRSAVTRQLVVIGLASFLHFYLRLRKPMLTQSIIPLKLILEDSLVQIHVFGRPASGDLGRPFKTSPGVVSMIKRIFSQVK